MKKSFRIASFLLMLVLVLAACAPAANNDMMKNDDMASDSMKDGTMEEATMESHDGDMEKSMDSEDDATMDESSDDMSGDRMLPEWAYLENTNISTGETFTLADYEGKVVLVESLAMWCPTCLKQQSNVKALHERLNSDDFVSIGLDVDLHESPEDLASYIADNGFDWTYTIASQDLARGIANQFGANFLNPPLAPIFLIDRHGGLHQLEHGLKSVDDLEAVIKPLLEDM
jgi:peroxiredoxin